MSWHLVFSELNGKHTGSKLNLPLFQETQLTKLQLQFKHWVESLILLIVWYNLPRSSYERKLRIWITVYKQNIQRENIHHTINYLLFKTRYTRRPYKQKWRIMDLRLTNQWGNTCKKLYRVVYQKVKGLIKCLRNKEN